MQERESNFRNRLPAALGAENFRGLSSEQRRQWIAAISDDEAEAIMHDWAFWHRPTRHEPVGKWVNWPVVAGPGSARGGW